MGIHKGAKGDNRFNLGTLIKSSIEEYNKLEKNQKLNINKGLFYNQNYSPQNFYDIIIHINSISDIIKGWKVEFNPRVAAKYKEYTDYRVMKIGVIGNSYKGKTFILSKLNKFKLSFYTKVQGLSIKYPELEKYPNRRIVFLDYTFSETPILSEKELIKDKENGSRNIIRNQLIKNELLFKEQLRDKVITGYFIQNYIIYNSDILIVVVGDLTFSDQKLLNKIKYELIRFKIEKTLFVIHNLMTYTTIQQVKYYIRETLLKSATFNLEQQFIIKINYEPINEPICYYEKNTSYNIMHLIFANEGSEAGEYYNKNTIKCLENYYEKIISLKPFDALKTVKEMFKRFSNEILENNEGIIFDDLNKNVIKLIKPERIELKKYLIDGSGFLNLKSGGYEPSYNYYRKGNKIIIRVEAPGASDIKTEIKVVERYTFIRIIVNKKKKE